MAAGRRRGVACSYVLQLVLRLAPTMDSRSGSAAAPLAAALSAACASAPARSCSPARSPPTATPGGRACSAALAAAALGPSARSAPVIAGARTRLDRRAAPEALTVYLDAASLLLAALVAALHPLGYVVVALLVWFLWRRTRARPARSTPGCASSAAELRIA